MAITTVTEISTLLASRCQKLADFAEVTITAGSPAMVDSITYGMRKAGLTLSDPINVVDADLVQVNEDNIDKMLDLAELRLLETIQGNLDDVDIIVGPERENYSQITSQLSLRILRLSRRVEKEYAAFKESVEGGTISVYSDDMV